MAKFKEVWPGQFAFWCPGCQCAHHIYTEGRINWTITGTESDTPTVRPSLAHNRGERKSQCHYHITDGKLEYFFDTFHQYQGQSIDMVDWDERIHNQYVIRPAHENDTQKNRSPQTRKLSMVCGFNFNKG